MMTDSEHSSETYDVIVVGAGSAGCVVAGRLAAETEARVLVLEDGGRDSSPLIDIPAGFSQLLAHKQFMYPYETVPQKHLDGRTISLIQGRGLGGGSSINAMVWMIGQARDYDGWQAAVGNTGNWRLSDLMPHFKAMEGNMVLSGPLHGTDGPVKVSPPQQIVPINQAVIKAFQEFGVPYNPDYNGEEQRGVGPCQLSIGDARRCSAADAYLHPAEGRANLTVRTGALVTRILLDGDQATGVELVHRGKTYQAAATEIVVSAGALSSPRILMLSGIGPEDELAKHGIQLRIRAQHVGRHLQDHPEVPVIAESFEDLGYTKAGSTLGMIEAGLRYMLTRTGPAASNGIESVAHFNPEALDDLPTVQCFHAPVVVKKALAAPDPAPGITLENVVLQPKSRGSVTLKDADPRSTALIDPNYLADPDDMRTMVLALRFAREVLTAPSLWKVLKPELMPGPDVRSDEDFAAYARQNMSCMLHPVGSCRMGSDDDAVVDADLRVRGVRGLRVVDASIMPNIVSANTMAATMVIASKGADLVKDALRS